MAKSYKTEAALLWNKVLPKWPMMTLDISSVYSLWLMIWKNKKDVDIGQVSEWAPCWHTLCVYRLTNICLCTVYVHFILMFWLFSVSGLGWHLHACPLHPYPPPGRSCSVCQTECTVSVQFIWHWEQLAHFKRLWNQPRNKGRKEQFCIHPDSTCFLINEEINEIPGRYLKIRERRWNSILSFTSLFKP